MTFKDLDWQDDDGIIFTKPDNLRWGYYINFNDLGCELNLLDDNFNHNILYSKNYNNLAEAKVEAKNHYINVLQNLCCKI